MSGLDDTSFTTRSTSATAVTITQNDWNVLLLSLTGATAVTLPAGSSVQQGREYTIYKDASAQTVTITPASGTIDGGANTTLASGAVHCKCFVTDGTNWFTLSAS